MSSLDTLSPIQREQVYQHALLLACISLHRYVAGTPNGWMDGFIQQSLSYQARYHSDPYFAIKQQYTCIDKVRLQESSYGTEEPFPQR